MSITSLSSTTGTTSSGSTTSSTNAANDPAAMQDRFLKLLVAQMNHQDPLNPMDNAQMTTQMAQINTVNGIQQLNTTLTGMAQQFTALQLLQGASMVGHNVLTVGNRLVPQNGTAQGAIDLAGSADSVKVDILSSGGQVINTLDLGPQQAGRVPFTWDATGYGGSSATYRVSATLGGQSVAATPLVSSKIISIGQDSSGLTLQLQGQGSVAYSDVKTIQ